MSARKRTKFIILVMIVTSVLMSVFQVRLYFFYNHKERKISHRRHDEVHSAKKEKTQLFNSTSGKNSLKQRDSSDSSNIVSVSSF